MAHLFIYGTLKRGQCSHHLLEGQTYLGNAATLPAYRLYHCGPFPGLVPANHGMAIEGELWQVDEPCLQRLDEFEGELFQRDVVRLAGIANPAYAYLYQGNIAGLNECGQRW